MGTQVLLGLTLNSLFIFYNPKHFRLGADAASWRFDCCPGPSVMVIVISNNVWPPSSPKGDVSQWALEYELTHWVNLAFKIRPVYYSVLQHLVQPTWTAQVFMSLICIVNRSSLQFTSVLPLCCYGKVLHFMMEKNRLQKQTYTQWKCVAMPNIGIVQLIVNQRQTKREIAATLVFAQTGPAQTIPEPEVRSIFSPPPLIAYDVILFKQPFHDLFK